MTVAPRPVRPRYRLFRAEGVIAVTVLAIGSGLLIGIAALLTIFGTHPR